jgi:hypothetical protein
MSHATKEQVVAFLAEHGLVAAPAQQAVAVGAAAPLPAPVPGGVPGRHPLYAMLQRGSGGGGARFTGVTAGTYSIGGGTITVNGKGQIVSITPGGMPAVVDKMRATFTGGALPSGFNELLVASPFQVDETGWVASPSGGVIVPKTGRYRLDVAVFVTPGGSGSLFSFFSVNGAVTLNPICPHPMLTGQPICVELERFFELVAGDRLAFGYSSTASTTVLGFVSNFEIEEIH